jgi:hypothetical protein
VPGRELGIRFLLVFLLDTMVHIVEHHDFMPEDFLMEEATSSTPQATNLPAPGAAAMHSTRQHTPAQTSRASRAAPGALSATRELLRHPPSSTASLGAMKQWRDDVDRLLGMAHSGSARPRPRSSRRQYEASASVRSPSVRAAPTEDLRTELNRRRAGEDAPVSLGRSYDLRAELNRRRAGEDARLSLERARERRQNVEGRNLDYDFAAVAPQTPTYARIQAGVPLADVGCAALADYLRAATWPSKFRLHLPEKYDGTSNPSEFLQVYVTAITAAGGDTDVMATYFHVALSGPARTWLMNLTPGSIYSWEELCARFTANFASTYQRHGVEAHLHAVRQEPGETLRAFISRFTKVRGTIPRISDASIITAFRQGVRDEKMLEKLATHDVETVTTLFALADKCARAAEGRAWHPPPQIGVAQTGGSGAVAQDGKKKKNRGHEKLSSAAPVVAAATGGRNKRNKRPRPQGGNSGSCPVHPNSRHSAAECREIIKLAKRVNERREQTSKDGSPPRRRPGKEKVDDGDVAAGERDLGYQSPEGDLGYQSPEGDLKDVFTGDSDSGDDTDRYKKLYVMYGGSWELTSRRNVKSLRREVLSTVPGVPKATPHQRWRSTTISFGASDCPDNMAGAGILPLITAPVIANIRLHHVLIDGGAGLNVISHAVFKQLQIPGSRLGPSRPFFGVGPQPVYPHGSIALPVTFGTENFRTENVQFDVAEVNLPFNAIIGRSALYRFMAIAHYGYLVLKMSPAGVLTVWGDRAAALAVVEKMHALAAEAARPDDGGRNPPISGTKAPTKVPKVRPSGADDVSVKAVQLRAGSSQTTRIAGDLEKK